RRFRWIMTMVLGMAFGFIAKENHFMHGAIIGMFFSGLALWQVIQGRMFLAVAPSLLGGGIGFWLLEAGQVMPALLVVGLGTAVAVALLVMWLGEECCGRLSDSDAADLDDVMVSLIMTFLVPFGRLVLGWVAMAYNTPTDLLRSVGIVLIMTALYVGFAYF